MVRKLFCFSLLALLVSGITSGFADTGSWVFKNAENTKDWQWQGLTDAGVSNGVWKLTATCGNPMMFTPPVSINAENRSLVTFRMRLGKGSLARGCFLFISDQQPRWDDRTVVVFDCHSDGEFHEYTVEMSRNPLWKGTVTQLRFQPFNAGWPLPGAEPTVELADFKIRPAAAATGAYGSQEKVTTASSAPARYDKTMSVRYVRIEENRGTLDFAELEACDAHGTNMAVRKPVRVSNPMWGDGSLGNDGNPADGGGNTVVMMRSPGGNWWEVDLGSEVPLTRVVIFMRDAARAEGGRPLDGATLSLLDRARKPVASCQLAVTAAEEKVTIPMDPAYFRYRDLCARLIVTSDPPGNIVAHERGNLRLVAPEPDALAGGSVLLKDLEGRTVRTIPLSRGVANYRIPLDRKGYYTVAATANYDGNLVVARQTSAVVVGEPLDDRTRLGTIFGVEGSAGEPFFDLGAAWSYTGIYTHHVRRNGQGYEWLPTATMIKNGVLDVSPRVNNVAMLCWLPEFMQSVPAAERGNSPTSPPKDYTEFVRFITWVTSAIPDFVKYVAPIGEPSWSFKGTPEELARYHEVVADTIRKVRPDIRIIGPMMSPGNSISIESIKTLDKLGLFAHMDGVSLNPYVVNWPTPFRSRMPEADFIEFVDQIIAYFVATGRPDYPVYLTEFGWYVGPGHVDELTRTQYSVRAAILLATRPTIKMANFFALGGGGGFSYLNTDGTPRPVYPAMAQTFRWLADCSNGRCIRLTPTSYLAAFRKGGGAGITLWDTKGDAIISVPIRSVTRIQDLMGRDVARKDGRLTAGPSPLFFDVTDASLAACFAAPATAPVIPLIPGKATDIGSFDAMVIPEALVRRGTTITAAPNAEPGEYRLIGKTRGTWRMIIFTIKEK